MNIIAVLSDVFGHNQLVLVVHYDLHIVAGNGLSTLGEQSGVFINKGNLLVATVFEPLLQGFFLGLLMPQLFKFLLQLSVVNQAAFACLVVGGVLLGECLLIVGDFLFQALSCLFSLSSV